MRSNSIIGMDRLDRLTGVAMILFALWLVLLIGNLDAKPVKGHRTGSVGATTAPLSPEYGGRLKTAAHLLESGNMAKLKPLLDGLIERYPYQAEPFMLLGDYYIRLQNPIAAMHAFRQGLDLNLDFLEKNSSSYQGKKIKNIVAEAEREIKNALAENSGDSAMRKNR